MNKQNQIRDNILFFIFYVENPHTNCGDKKNECKTFNMKSIISC